MTEVGFKLRSNLAIEVLSPEDRALDVRARVEEYLLCGVTLVLVIDPDNKSVAAYRRLSAPIALHAGDDVLEFEDGGPRLPLHGA